MIARVATRAGEPADQIERLVECREVIRREVRGRKTGKPHIAALDGGRWSTGALTLRSPATVKERDLEDRARTEKSAALEQLFRSRRSVLIDCCRQREENSSKTD